MPCSGFYAHSLPTTTPGAAIFLANLGIARFSPVDVLRGNMGATDSGQPLDSPSQRTIIEYMARNSKSISGESE
jgi:hypothetical protein